MVESEKPLYDNIVNAISDLPKVIVSEKDSEIKKYESLLNSMKDLYADYYLGQYTKCRLSKSDALVKERMMGSLEKRICDVLKDSEFITSTEYQNLINSISSLKEAESGITKTRVLEEPYHDFNPREFYGKPNFKIQELGDQLNAILEKWTNAMKSILKDPSIQDNMELLKADDRKLIEEFRAGKIELNETNAQRLRNLISELAKGIDRVEIPLEDFRKQLNKPLTPNEAIETLITYIDSLCVGKERNKVRIIIK